MSSPALASSIVPHRLIATTGLVSLCAAAAQAAFVSSTYVGPAGGNWDVASNWSAGVPDNGVDTFGAVIPAGSSVLMNISAEVDSMSIGAGGLVTVGNSFDPSVVVGPVTNDGTILLASTGSSTELTLQGDVTFTGSGAIDTTNSQLNRIRGSLATNRRLTNAAGHTIRGAMAFGSNANLLLTNEGLIEATLPAGILFDLVGTTNINNGTIQSNGGTLTIQNTVLDNTLGEIVALDGSETRLSGATIVGGDLRSEGSGLLRATGNSSLDDVSLDGELVVNNSVDITLLTQVENSGTLRLASTGSTTELDLDVVVTFLGGGQVLLDGNTEFSRILGTGGDRLINAADHAIRGSGSVGVNLLVLTNEGLIESTQPAGTIIDLQGTTAENFNNGTIAAVGGDIALTVTAIDNSLGEIVAGDGMEVVLTSSTILGGVLRSEGSGQVRLVGSSTLDSIEFSGTLVAPNGVDPLLRNFIVNDGTIFLQSTGGATDLTLQTDVELQGTGQVSMSDSASNRILGSFRLTNTASHSIRGAGNIGVNQSRLTNEGLIEAVGAVGLTIDLAGGVADNLNPSTMRSTSGPLIFSGTAIDNSGGWIIAGDGQETRFTTGSTVAGGTLACEGSGLLRVTGSLNIASLTLDGTLAVNNTADLGLSGTIENQGEIQLNSLSGVTQAILSSDATLSGTGTLRLSNSQFNQVLSSPSGLRLVNDALHTIEGAGNIGTSSMNLTNSGLIVSSQSTPLIIDVATDFLNEGVLDVATGNMTLSPGAFTNTGIVLVNAGRTLTRSGDYVQTGGLTRLLGTLAMIAPGTAIKLQGGTLEGTGAITGTGGGIQNTGGTVSPGASIGTLTAGTFTQSGSGELAIEIGPGGATDLLTLTGNATLGGTLVVTRSGSFTPMVGDTFVILTCGSRTGEFDGVISCDPIEVIYGPTSVTLQILKGSGILGDFNGDGVVDGSDLGTLLASWGVCGGACCNADLNGDGQVDGADLGILLSNWG